MASIFSPFFNFSTTFSTVTLAVSGDSQGSATLGNEPLSVRGQPAVSDVWSQLWPGGSGSSLTLNAVDGTKSNSTG